MRPTLCDPIDGSPPGSPVPGILQARTLEWVPISFSNAWKWKVKVKSPSCVQLFATPWTAAYQASPSMGFSQARALEWVAVAFSVVFLVFLVIILYKQIQTVFTLFPHFLLYIMDLRFIHIIACIICSFLLLSIIPFYGCTIQWNDKHSNDRHLSCSLGMLQINEHSCANLGMSICSVFILQFCSNWVHISLIRAWP